MTPPRSVLGRGVGLSELAVHLTLYMLADERGEVPISTRDLADQLGVHQRIVQLQLQRLSAAGLVERTAGRLRLVGVAADEASAPSDLLIADAIDRSPAASTQRSIDRRRDPGIADAIHGSPAPCDPAIADAIDRSPTRSIDRRRDLLIAEAIPGSPRARAEQLHADQQQLHACMGPEVERLARLVETLSPAGATVAAGDCREGLAALLADEPAVDVERYLRSFAALCVHDSDQRGYWTARMLSREVGRGRRLSPWGAVKNTVNRAGRRSAPSAEAAPSPTRRWGGGRVKL